MGGKSKLFLKERGVPTIFSFAPETTRKRREYSIKRSEKSAKKLCIEEAISSHETCSSHVYTEAVARRCSVKKVFLEISQNSQENNCVRVSF